MKLAFLVPGPIDQLTGGYLFARRVVDFLRARGDGIEVVELAGRFPDADPAARQAAANALANLANGSSAVIDGLALAGFEDCLAREAGRLRLLGWVHHPLADETGLSAAEAARFRDLEVRLVPLFRGVICPSQCTADAVARYGVAAGRIAAAPPGTSRPAQPRQRMQNDGVLRFLSVATVTPRKGHLVLIDALARLRRADWQLDCIGSTTRDPAYAEAVRASIAANRLESRIVFRGEMAPAALGPAYDAADLFVLPSFHEGYGMVFAEALAHGLPIVAARAGAIPETVPESAAMLVPPGDAAALAAALTELLAHRVRLFHLAKGAAAAGAALPDWPQAAAHWRAQAQRLLA